MKNILKKLGVLGLIVAILLPFVELPIVNAETTDGCETHLQNYMFLDVLAAHEFDDYEDGYVTYGNFPYIFSESGNIKNIKTEVNYVTEDREITQYWALYNTILNYSALSNTYSYRDNNKNGQIFVNENTRNYTTDTILLHGKWAKEEDDGDAIISEWDSIDNAKEITLQNISTKLSNAMDDNSSVTINGAAFSETKNEFYDLSGNSNVADFFKNIAEGEIPSGSVWESNQDKEYVALKISRKFSSNAFDGLIFGYKGKDSNGNDKVYVFSKRSTDITAGDKLGDQWASTPKDKIVDSYEAYIAYTNLTESEQNAGTVDASKYIKTLEGGTIDDVDIVTGGETATRYYWPVVLNVEYETCPETDEDGVVREKWTLEYDANVDDPKEVTNMPAGGDEANVNESITIDSGKPSRSGYTFKAWCENKNGSGECYNPGEKVTSDTATTVTLFAQWGKTDTEENKGTGVVSYIIGFAAVGIVAGGIYLISKKKNLFRQI